ncbi:hypothetical protein ACNKHO_20480 [Shigella flexneri]
MAILILAGSNIQEGRTHDTRFQDSILFQTGYLVNGIWKNTDTTFDALNPATGEVVAKVAKAGKPKRRGVSLGRVLKAFPGMARENGKERSAILFIAGMN